MAKTSASIDVDLTPEQAFAAVTDMDRYGDWLVFHGGWHGAPPEQGSIGKGTEVSTMLQVKDASLPFHWKVDAFTAPREFRFSGKEKGVKVGVSLAVKASGTGSTVSFELELRGLPVAGPIGKAVVKQLRPDVEESLTRFAAAFG